MIKPNQKFWAYPYELPAGARDVIISLDDGVPLAKLTEAEVETPPEVESHDYKLDHRGGGWYNVLDSNEKVVNENALKKEEAEELIGQLEGE